MTLSVLALFVPFLASEGPVHAGMPEPPVPAGDSSQDPALTPVPKGLLEKVIMTKVPETTPILGLIELKVEELFGVGLAWTTSLGISVADMSEVQTILTEFEKVG